MSPIRRFTAFAAVVPIALLAGCGYTPIMSADGAGTCDGKGDFTLTTTQSIDAHDYTVTYDGPADVSLVVSQGFYVDNLEDYGPDVLGADQMFFSLTDDVDNLHAYRIDTENAGWTTTGSGANTHHAFAGTYEELIDGQTLGAGLDPDQEPLVDTYAPAIVGVVCDDTVATGFFESSTGSDYIDSIQFEAAAHLDAGHLLLDPIVIDTSVAVAGGRTGTAHFPASNATVFGDFVPESVQYVELGADAPDVPNGSFSELWFNLIVSSMGNPSGLELSFPNGISADGTFDWDLDVYPEAVTGNYIVALKMHGTDDTGDAARVAFMNLYFDADNGIAFLDPIGDPVNPDLSGLANTGVEAGSIGLVAGGLLVAGAAVAAVSLGRRRQK
jgi:LPXTG-motif cell wall-anchored protein